MADQNQTQNFQCLPCNKSFKTIQAYKSHLKSQMHLSKEKKKVQKFDINSAIKEYNANITKVPKNVSFKFKHIEYEWEYNDNQDDEIMKEMENILNNYYKLYKSFKFYLSYEVLYFKNTLDGNLDKLKMCHVSNVQVLTNVNDIKDKLNDNIDDLGVKIYETELRDSNWSLLQITKVNLYLIKYKDATGGTYIQLPFKSSYIINIKNKDNRCFLWCVIAYLHPANDHVDRLKNYNKEEYINELNLNDIEFPVDYNTIKKFNNQNNEIIEVNVFNIDVNGETSIKRISPIFISHHNPKGCNLLYYEGHYVLCKDISVFLNKTEKHKSYPCLNCLTSYSTQNALNNHLIECKNYDSSKVTFSKDEYLSFNKYHYKNKVPFTIYADFESWNKVLNNEVSNTSTEVKIYEQLPMCYGMYIHSNYPNLFKSEYYKYFGEDCLKVFVEKIIELQSFFMIYYKLILN